MANVQTSWGYSVDIEGGSIPAILTYDEFQELGGSALSSSQARQEAVLAAVSSAVRNWCGWHVAPSLTCRIVTDGAGRQLQLPLMGVTSVTSLTVCGDAVTDYEWRSSGHLRLRCGWFPDAWRSVEVVCRAGYNADTALGQIVAQLAINELAATAGIREEHAGQVGASYNQTDAGVSGGVRLLASDKEMLAPYVLRQAM